jgi:hypothetical protein
MERILVVGGVGAVIAAKLIAQLDAQCSRPEFIHVGDNASPEEVEKLEAAFKEAGEAVRIVAGAMGIGKSFGFPPWELKACHGSLPEVTMLPMQGGSELKHLRRQSQFHLNKKQQSLMAKARRR